MSNEREREKYLYIGINANRKFSDVVSLFRADEHVNTLLM